jgi:hypothetical protein
MEYSGARGNEIHEKNLKSKVSYQTPFNIKIPILSGLLDFFIFFSQCFSSCEPGEMTWRKGKSDANRK